MSATSGRERTNVCFAVIMPLLVTCLSARYCRAGEHGGSHAEPIDRLAAVRAGVLARPLAEQERKELSDLFDSIASERRRLKGRVPWKERPTRNAKGLVEPPDVRLRKLLNEAVKRVGVAVPAAVAFDSAGHDYARNAALTSLMRHQEYVIDDLPVLTSVFVLLTRQSEEEPYARGHYGGWVSAWAARDRLAGEMGRVLNVPYGGSGDGPLSPKAASRDPTLFLSNLLQRAMSLEKNRSRATLIAACLATVGP